MQVDAGPGAEGFEGGGVEGEGGVDIGEGVVVVLQLVLRCEIYSLQTPVEVRLTFKYVVARLDSRVARIWPPLPSSSAEPIRCKFNQHIPP
jgi:hypothetical protein